MLGVHKMLDKQQGQCIIIVKWTWGSKVTLCLIEGVNTPNAMFLSLTLGWEFVEMQAWGMKVEGRGVLFIGVGKG
jgi:hypothetical protein